MGFWAKAKGVFNRITNGVKGFIKKIYDNKDKIKDAIEPFVPDQYRPIIDKGERVIDNVQRFVR